MKRFETVREVAHSADRMYALVADVERYPEFVPLCKALRVTERRAIEGGERLLAAMTVAYGTFRYSFTSRVTLLQENREILVEYVDGPFRSLENRWTFALLGEDACEVGFCIEYELRGRALQLVAGAVFDRAFRMFVGAFEARADRLYGDEARSAVNSRPAARPTRTPPPPT